VRRGVHAAAARWSGAEVLLAAVPAAIAHQAAEAARQRPGQGGAVGPFPDPADELIEELAERIAREVEAMPRSCRWCCKSLENGHLWCCDVCREDYHRKLMPVPFAKSRDGSIIPDMARIVKRKKDLARAAAWRAEHGL
jgi:hypothetical protein